MSASGARHYSIHSLFLLVGSMSSAFLVTFRLVLLVVGTCAAPLKLSKNDTCCMLAKLNIDVDRANVGREFFAEMILDEQSYKDINEDRICSLMHFFMQQAALNRQPIQFSRGMFILYDSSKQFFARLMAAKDAQPSKGNADLTGYYNRLKHFALHSLHSIIDSDESQRSASNELIYVRGDESSHFRERGPEEDRKTTYPA